MKPVYPLGANQKQHVIFEVRPKSDSSIASPPRATHEIVNSCINPSLNSVIDLSREYISIIPFNLA
jgi:hypothetical protein